jgi:hypothetical protein
MSDRLIPPTLMNPTRPDTERDTNRGGRPPRHALRQAERLVMNHRLRTNSRLGRAVAQIEQKLADEPLDTLRDNYRGRIARKEVLAQIGEQYVIKTGDTGPMKWLVWLWNSLRRDVELFTSLPDPSRREKSLTEYLNEKASLASEKASLASAISPDATPAAAVGTSTSSPAAAAPLSEVTS